MLGFYRASEARLVPPLSLPFCFVFSSPPPAHRRDVETGEAEIVRLAGEVRAIELQGARSLHKTVRFDNAGK
jgi:hypothetical protein